MKYYFSSDNLFNYDYYTNNFKLYIREIENPLKA